MSEERPPKPSDLIAPIDFVNHWDLNVSENTYHADRTSVGSSQLRLILDSPMAFYDSYYGPPEEPKEKEHFRIGKIVHMAILEPERFKSLYITMPKFVGLTKDGRPSEQSKEAKEKKADWLAALPEGFVIVTEADLQLITGIAKSIMAHPQGPDLIKDCVPEITGYYRDPITGIKVRIRPDLLKKNYKALTDLKTAKSTKDVFFGSSAFDHRYDLQLATYLIGTKEISGVKPSIVTSMAAEKTRPYETAIYYWEDADLYAAFHDYRYALDMLSKCIETNKWPYRQQTIERIKTPQWFVYQRTEDL